MPKNSEIEVTCNQDFFENKIKYGEKVKGFLNGIYIGEEKDPNSIFPWKRLPAIIRQPIDFKHLIEIVYGVPKIKQSNYTFPITSNHPRYLEFRKLIDETV